MSISSLLTVLSLLAAFYGFNNCHADPNDLCAIGHADDTNALVNGNFTYKGIDTTNSNKPYWFHECFNVAIEWSEKYVSGYNFYILKQQDAVAFYGFCLITNANPYDCDGYWYIWDGAQFLNVPTFTVNYCSYYLVKYICVC